MNPSDQIQIHTLSARLTLPLRPAQLPLLRGAVALDAGWEDDLFHNHAPAQVGPPSDQEDLAGEDLAGFQKPARSKATARPEAKLLRQPATLKDSYIHRYPLIHYRVERGQAALFGVNEGATALKRWLLQQPGQLQIGARSYPLMIDQLRERRHDFGLLPAPRRYRLLDYLALNQENYQRWQQASGLIERMQLLQGALTGHLLGLCTAFGYQVPNRQLQVNLLDMRDHRPVKLHGTPYLAFGLVYETNLALPPGIALGRGVAYGYGRQQPVKGHEG